MEDMMLELLEDCRQKELYCMHNDVDDLIERVLNSKLLSINVKSQRLDKEKQEVKNIVEQPTKRRTRSLQNFKIIHKKSSISLNNTTILETESDEVIKSSVENLVPILSESEVTFDNESEFDMPVNDESSRIFTTFSNHLFDCNDNFTSSNDKSLSNKDEFSSELAYIDPIPLGIKEVDFDLKEEIRLVENLLYYDLIPLGIENDDYDSEGDFHFLEELLSDDPLSLLKNELSNFDHHDDLSFLRPPPEPSDVEVFFDCEPDTVVLTAKVVEDISEHYVLMPKVLPSQPTFCSNFDTLLPFSSENEDKVFKPGILSYPLVSHQDKIISDFSEDPMMISGGDIPLLDVPYLYFYPP
nr:hypothetical protein [Tanacetum cinerariifolium]